MSNKHVVLAYSGGLDTTVILHWLASKGYEVTAFLADVGQRTEDLELIGARARRGGAARFISVNLREEFLNDFFLPCLHGHAQYEGRYLLGTSIARPLIAKAQVSVAKEVGANLVAHGATGKGNDQVRFELTYQSLAPEIGILPVWRNSEFIAEFNAGRRSMLAYAEKHQLEVKASAAKPWSSDDNLLHISYEAGILEDPWLSAPPALFERMVHPTAAPEQMERMIIRWQSGVPVQVTRAVPAAPEPGLGILDYSPGESLAEGLAAVFDYVDHAAARNGVGSLGLVESRYVGMKSRGEYHAPGHTVLLSAHRDIEALCLTGSVILEKERRMPDFAASVYNGYWYDPAAVATRTFIHATQHPVSGETRVALYKGNVIIEGRRSPFALYDAQIATMDGEGAYRQEDASGFIRLHGLPLRVRQRVQGDL
jgi:argininosuccinate synthase